MKHLILCLHYVYNMYMCVGLFGEEDTGRNSLSKMMNKARKHSVENLSYRRWDGLVCRHKYAQLEPPVSSLSSGHSGLFGVSVF